MPTLLSDAGLEPGFKMAAAGATGFVFDAGIAILDAMSGCISTGALEAVFAFGLAFGAGRLGSPLTA